MSAADCVETPSAQSEEANPSQESPCDGDTAILRPKRSLFSAFS